MDWIQAALQEADMLHSSEEIDVALDRMAQSITQKLVDTNPLVLAVMIGGLIPAGRLLPKLAFPLELDYIHATRYRGSTRGFSLQWRARPLSPIRDRVVLLIDDILDEGITLGAIFELCVKEGARAVYSAVLVEKRHNRKPVIKHADFTGLEVDDRYVFGCGMDYKGYLRNVAGIYAVKGL